VARDGFETIRDGFMGATVLLLKNESDLEPGWVFGPDFAGWSPPHEGFALARRRRRVPRRADGR
jgi:hypothetical protein